MIYNEPLLKYMVVTPNNMIIHVNNLSEFCKEHNLLRPKMHKRLDTGLYYKGYYGFRTRPMKRDYTDPSRKQMILDQVQVTKNQSSIEKLTTQKFLAVCLIGKEDMRLKIPCLSVFCLGKRVKPTTVINLAKTGRPDGFGTYFFKSPVTMKRYLKTLGLAPCSDIAVHQHINPTEYNRRLVEVVY